MNITRRFVSFATQILNPQRWLAAAKRKAVRIEVVAIGLLLVPVILVMADHLPFVDVPSSAFYHDAVSALFGAGITTGTTPTTFSPDDLVTRGQMAVFLHRGLGRVTYGQSTDILLGNDAKTIATVTIYPGGAAGGIGYLKVDAAFTATNTSTLLCPCRIIFYLTTNINGQGSLEHEVTLYDVIESVTSAASGAVTRAFSLYGAGPHIVRLQAHIANAVPPNHTSIRGRGSITALWVPFGATGGTGLSAASAEQGEAPPGTEPDGKPDTER